MVVTVIVPTLNEETLLPRLLRGLSDRTDTELIVVDGGSHDQTVELAKRFTKFVFQSRPGRALQMNEGARHATGDILLFLHADSILAVGAIDEIQHHMIAETAVGGAFDLQIDSSGIVCGFIERLSSLRSRLFRLPYGDQGIFVSRQIFEAIGGYPEIPIMEDIAFARKLRHRGKLTFLKSGLVTSSRRWTQNGIIKTTLINWVMTVLFYFGIQPEHLRSYYDRLLQHGRMPESRQELEVELSRD